MDLKGNTTMAELIRGQKRSRRALLQDFLKVCDAIAYAHSQEIIHLDLKPQNIQCDFYGEVLVCDWGLGKLAAQEDEETVALAPSETMDNMTLVGEIKGTPGYMAPEQVEKGGLKDYRTDVFSLGCILHAILTGQPPFKGSPRAVLKATLESQIPNPCESYPDCKVPPSLGAVTFKALATNPEERYESVSELKEEVHRFLDGFSTDAEAPNFIREAGLFVSRNRTPFLISFLSLILVTVLSTLFIGKLNDLRASVFDKAQLADQYASEAESANDLYQETLSESKEQQLALSEALIFSTKRLKSKGIFDTPMKSIREAKALAAHAHALDPDSKVAQYELFALNFIQLNFQEALNYPLSKGNLRYSYMLLAEAFPEFAYDRYQRPSEEVLIEFLEKAGEIDLGQSAILERIISYDAALRFSRISYEEVILSFLKYLNPEAVAVALRYESSQSSLYLRSETNLRLISDPGGSGECVLRYLEPRSLILELQEEFDLANLQNLAISELDLTRCEGLRLERPLYLPSVKEIRIDSQKHSSEMLRQWIRSSAAFEIIEVDSSDRIGANFWEGGDSE